METLAIIKDQDITGKPKADVDINYKLRECAKAVVMDSNGKIALLYVSKLNYYTLSGGGIEQGESKLECLVRECLEETGCYIHSVKELGKVVEYRDRVSQIQKSYCYTAKVKGEKGEPKFEEAEIKNGFKLLWVDLDKAINLIKNTKTDDYLGKFVIKRELAILEKAKDLYK